jgi:hypothetical protein
MKSRGENRRRDARVTAIAAAALAPIFAVLATGTSLGQDTSKSDSSWERTESVLVVPPVYLPDTSTSADACAEDCPSSIPPAGGGTPIAVSGSADNESNASAGTADNPSDESVAVGGYAPDGSNWQEEQAAVARPQQGTGAPDNPLGSVQEYDERQAEAEQRGNYGAVQAPSVIIAVPAGAYAASGAASAPPPSRRRGSVVWRRGFIAAISIGLLDAATDGQDSAAATDRSARGPANDESLSGRGLSRTRCRRVRRGFFTNAGIRRWIRP